MNSQKSLGQLLRALRPCFKQSLYSPSMTHTTIRRTSKDYVTTMPYFFQRVYLSSTKKVGDDPKVMPKALPFTKRIMQFLGSSEPVIRAKSAESLLQTCVIQAKNTSFYRHGRVSDVFRSSHSLLVLHVWMVHKRLLEEGEEGKNLDEAVFDRLWEETISRIRALKVNELSVNSYLKEVQAYSFGACVAYDASQEKDSDEEKIQELAQAIYRNVYLRDESIDEDYAIKLANYVQRELNSLKSLPRAAILEARFKFGALPQWSRKALKPGVNVSHQHDRMEEAGGVKGKERSAEKEEEEEDQDEEEGGEWRTAYTDSGRLYYWNIRTRESVWEKPS